MTPAASHRSKASRLRKRLKKGERLSAADAKWLAAYEKTTKPKTVRIPDERREDAPTPKESPVVHVTEPASTGGTPDDHTWVPKVPEAPEAAPGEVPPEASTPVGAPVVPPPPPPPPSESGAQQLAGFMTTVVGVGIWAMQQLVADANLPAMLRGVVYSDELAAKWLTLVHGASMRLAYKYNVQAVPYADEILVLGSASASVVMTVMAAKKQLSAPRGALPRRAPEASTPPPQPPAFVWPTTQPDPTRPQQNATNAEPPPTPVPIVGVGNGAHSGDAAARLEAVNKLWSMPRAEQ